MRNHLSVNKAPASTVRGALKRRCVMKRVKSGCISQTLVFSQKPELGLTKNEAIHANRQELTRYKVSMEHSRTKFVILDETVQDDGSILVHVKKQINATTDTSEYFK